MSNKDVDMFKLVEEVEKQKSANIDEIFSTLDSVKDNPDIETEVKHTSTTTSSNGATPIRKPVVPESIGNFDTRFDAFKTIIGSVDYGDNPHDYVSGHKDALEKYYSEAYNNSKDLYVIEARINDEINKFKSRENIYDKGYYDGLFYALKAIRKSKELTMMKLNKEINMNL